MWTKLQSRDGKFRVKVMRTLNEDDSSYKERVALARQQRDAHDRKTREARK